MDTSKSSPFVTRLLAAPLPLQAYDWFMYTRREPYVLFYREDKGGARITKGTIFGVRPSTDGKQIRLILKESVPNKVFTLSRDDAKRLARNCIRVKAKNVY